MRSDREFSRDTDETMPEGEREETRSILDEWAENLLTSVDDEISEP